MVNNFHLSTMLHSWMVS